MPKQSSILQLLSDLKFKADCIKYPNTPVDFIPRKKFSDKNTNELTKSVIAFINLVGGQAERISSTGRVIDNRQVVTDVLGRKGTIGSMGYIPGNGKKGTADISATYLGRSTKVEVKFSKDVQSKVQSEYEQSIKRAGGVYMIAQTAEQFYYLFCQTFNEHPPAFSDAEGWLNYWQLKHAVICSPL